VCRELSNGVSVVIDATEGGFQRLRHAADSNLMPYFRIEPTIGPFARAAADYVLNLNVTDAALIFQNEAGTCINTNEQKSLVSNAHWQPHQHLKN
jgi:hypothetical protein